MKRVLSMLLALILTFSLAACNNTQGTASDTYTSTPAVSIQTQNTETESSSSGETDTAEDGSEDTVAQSNGTSSSVTENNTITVKPTINTNTSLKVEASTINKDTVIKPEQTVPAVKPQIPASKDEQKTESGNDVVADGDVKVEDIPTTEEIPEQEKVPEIKEEIIFETKHTALSQDKYYQYSTLNANQKKVYNEIIDAIKNTKNIINISSYNIPREEGQIALQKALTDHPEFFYVSKYTSTTYNCDTGNLTTIFLYYTDGITVDKLDSNYQLTVTANRTNIANQIKEFNKKTEEILKLIPLNTTQVAKEKFIHDYLVDHITYDNEASSKIGNLVFGQAMSHVWDVYGALVEGSSVCEGYAKAFSYLCHCVGINATTVSGYTSGGSHMWDAVLIDDEWYFIDVTWDDGDFSDTPVKLYIYSYFNGTTNEFGKTHLVDTKLAYPTCASVKNTYWNTYAINMESGELSSNYKFVIDEAVKNKDDLLEIYIGSNGISGSALLKAVVRDTSPVQKYIKEKGYNITITSQTVSYGYYTCFIIKYK